MSFKAMLIKSAFVLAFLMAAGMAANEMVKYSIDLSTNDTVGTYLVNQTGFTLYYFMNDAPGNGVSSCVGKCAEIWPPFYVETLTIAPGLNAADFTSQLRADGKKQTAYKGWPLYIYSKDKKPKDIYGQGVNNIWFVVSLNSTTFKKPSYQTPSPVQSSYPSSGGYSSGGY